MSPSPGNHEWCDYPRCKCEPGICMASAKAADEIVKAMTTPTDDQRRLIDAVTFPAKSRPIRRELVRRYDKCPDCGRDLDTGGECIECGYDAIAEFPKTEREGF